MNVVQIFRTVNEGRLFTHAGFAWYCPECGALLEETACRETRDRRALAHCLQHRDVSVPPSGESQRIRHPFTELPWKNASFVITPSRLKTRGRPS